LKNVLEVVVSRGVFRTLALAHVGLAHAELAHVKLHRWSRSLLLIFYRDNFLQKVV
jgi:hypothetical protein